MSTSTLTPNMSLVVPTVGQEAGPQYATDINNDLTLLDAHNHTPGSGVLITPAAMNINTSLTFNSNPALALQYLTFTSQGSVAALGSLYIAGDDLWYNDPLGSYAPLQITSQGALNVVSSGISSGTNLASFSANILKVWQNAATLTPASVQMGSVILGNTTAASNFVTISPALATPGYSITLPTGLPSALSFLTIDNSGNMSTTLLNGTLTTSNLSPTAGITGNQLATNTVQVSNLYGAARQIQSQEFSSSGTFTFPAASSTLTVYKITCVGPGGGGSQWNNGGAGGGAGGTSITYATGFTPSTTATVTISGGGAGASSNATAGAAGLGNTTFVVSAVTIASAGPGAGGFTNGTYTDAGAAGTGLTGTILCPGSPGSVNQIGSSNVTIGSGGASSLAGGGIGACHGAGRDGGAAGSKGSGGGAGWTSPGGAGGNGYCIIEWVL